MLFYLCQLFLLVAPSCQRLFYNFVSDFGFLDPTVISWAAWNTFKASLRSRTGSTEPSSGFFRRKPETGSKNPSEFSLKSFRIRVSTETSKLAHFSSTSLQLASARWDWSTFSRHCPLSSKQCLCLTSSISTIFSFEKLIGNAGNQT